MQESYSEKLMKIIAKGKFQIWNLRNFDLTLWSDKKNA